MFVAGGNHEVKIGRFPYIQKLAPVYKGHVRKRLK